MLSRKQKKIQQSKGQGVAAAKQLGLFVDFNPEGMVMDFNDDGEDDEDLEAELASITHKKPAMSKPKPKGKTPLPMEDIAKMAEECMQDIDDDDDDEDLENDEDLLAELHDVVGEDDEENTELEMEVTEMPTVKETPTNILPQPEPKHEKTVAAVVSVELQQKVTERLEMYKTAISNAKEAGETSKVRRYERGLKTLESMITAVKKGRPINEEEIPPPVASGKSLTHDSQPEGPSSEVTETTGEVLARDKAPAAEDLPGVSKTKERAETPESEYTANSAPKTEKQQEASTNLDAVSDTKASLIARQKAYKLAAVRAKQQGEIEKAKRFMLIGKKFDTFIMALDGGQQIDLSSVPPALEEFIDFEKKPDPIPTSAVPVENTQPVSSSSPPTSVGNEAPSQPVTVLDALQQRLEKYNSAVEQAKAAGDERKARMHQRIAKQYQDAIRAHKAGRHVNYAELPVPPGYPPIPGVEGSGGEEGVAAVLKVASRLATEEVKEDDDDDDNNDQKNVPSKTESQPPAFVKKSDKPEKPTQIVKPMLAPSPPAQGEKSPRTAKRVSPVLPSLTKTEKAGSQEQLSTAAQQLEFLENRKKQYMKAAVQAKQKKDIEQAKAFLRIAKGFDHMIEEAKEGKTVDISKVPSPPADEDDDFVLVHHSDAKLSEKTEELYEQLMKMLKEQYEKCVQYSKQFIHLGNVAETTKFEKMADECKKNTEILKLAQAQGTEPPKYHFEDWKFKTVRIFPELTSTELELLIVKGLNLPAPQGMAANDLYTFVRFEFHYPSSEQAQKNKTNVIKCTNCPEYNQSFKLNINRTHRGFRRIIQTKGIKLEIFHKGGFLRSDKLLGTAHIKLEKLETESEVREIMEVFDGRKPTGGKLEVKARLREPLNGQDIQTCSERWLVFD
ncbi:coiled-coil and C2 domain-containing protein 1B [Protopterus annectens]|uniref:coiled-coil and C2 domain-containing protein 1B n=1 Tax=Protopterus annectens TaxID=7888 RepID=UPI001CF9DC74|nr:coiled-coil and C2 domain-containing protein 1B [Protopterus annectens]